MAGAVGAVTAAPLSTPPGADSPRDQTAAPQERRHSHGHRHRLAHGPAPRPRPAAMPRKPSPVRSGPGADLIDDEPLPPPASGSHANSVAARDLSDRNHERDQEGNQGEDAS